MTNKKKNDKNISPQKKRGGPRENSGRPAIEPNEKFWEDAEQLAHMQCTQAEICGFLKIDVDTFCRKIQEKYGFGFSEWKAKFSEGGKASLRRRMWYQAMSDGKDSVKAAIWLSKNYLGMKDSITHEGGDRPFLFAYQEESELE